MRGIPHSGTPFLFRRIGRLPRCHWHPCPEVRGSAQPLQSEAPYAQNAGKGPIWSVCARAVNTIYGVARPLQFPLPKTDLSSKSFNNSHCRARAVRRVCDWPFPRQVGEMASSPQPSPPEEREKQSLGACARWRRAGWRSCLAPLGSCVSCAFSRLIRLRILRRRRPPWGGRAANRGLWDGPSCR